MPGPRMWRIVGTRPARPSATGETAYGRRLPSPFRKESCVPVAPGVAGCTVAGVQGVAGGVRTGAVEAARWWVGQGSGPAGIAGISGT